MQGGEMYQGTKVHCPTCQTKTCDFWEEGHLMKARDFDDDHITTRCDCGHCKCGQCGEKLSSLQPYLCLPAWTRAEFQPEGHIYCGRCIESHAEGCKTLEKLAS